jgi:uncharacterized protein (DUF779 family)
MQDQGCGDLSECMLGPKLDFTTEEKVTQPLAGTMPVVIDKRKNRFWKLNYGDLCDDFVYTSGMAETEILKGRNSHE